MSSYCTNCKRPIGKREFSLSYSPHSFVFCVDCYQLFKDSIFALKTAETQEEVNKVFEEQEPILLEKGITQKALIEVKKYFKIPLTEEEINLDPLAKQLNTQVEVEDGASNFGPHMLTTGNNFEGFRIKKYFGIVSGHYVVGTGAFSEFKASFSDAWGISNRTFAEKMNTAKSNATEQLIRYSRQRGGNSVIGVSFNYVVFDNNLIGVSANGTSVLIEKIDEKSEVPTEN